MKKLLLLFLACSVLFGCCGDCNKTSTTKKRKIALHGYVYRKVMTLEETVLEAKMLGADGVVCTSTQKIAKRFGNTKFTKNMTAEQKAFVKKLFADNGIEFVSYGLWDIKKGETPDMYLSFCKEMGIPVFTWEGNWDKAQMWNDASKKWGVKVAIHNHQKNPKNPKYQKNPRR